MVPPGSGPFFFILLPPRFLFHSSFFPFFFKKRDPGKSYTIPIALHALEFNDKDGFFKRVSRFGIYR